MVQGVDQVWVGVAEIGLGLIFCFIGYTAARVVLALWGALLGFFGGTVAQVMLTERFDNAMLSSIPWWAFALAGALILAWLSFAFYAVGVLVSMGAFGWGVGQLLSSAMHLPDWVAFSMGLVVAAGLIMLGWTLSLPKVLLVVMTALAGAAAVIDGVQFFLGHRIDWFDQTAWRTDATLHITWTIAFVILAGAGMFLQFQQRTEGNLRESYRHV